jgi:hypothetical protein
MKTTIYPCEPSLRKVSKMSQFELITRANQHSEIVAQASVRKSN